MIKISCYTKEYKENDTALFSLSFPTNLHFEVSSSNQMTSRRTETGFQITDNILLDPRDITMSGIIGDINITDEIPFSGLFNIPLYGSIQNKNFIKQLRLNLERLRNEKLFLVVYNNKDGKYYRNYQLKNMKISDNLKSSSGFDYSLTLKEVNIGTVGEVSISTKTVSPFEDGTKGEGSIKTDGTNSGLQSFGASVFDRIAK